MAWVAVFYLVTAQIEIRSDEYNKNTVDKKMTVFFYFLKTSSACLRTFCKFNDKNRQQEKSKVKLLLDR